MDGVLRDAEGTCRVMRHAEMRYFFMRWGICLVVLKVLIIEFCGQ